MRPIPDSSRDLARDIAVQPMMATGGASSTADRDHITPQDFFIRYGAPIYAAITTVVVGLAAWSDAIPPDKNGSLRGYDLLAVLPTFNDGILLLAIIIVLSQFMAYWRERSVDLWCQIDTLLQSYSPASERRPSLAGACRTEWRRPMRFLVMLVCFAPVIGFIATKVSGVGDLLSCALGNCSHGDAARNVPAGWLWLLVIYVLPLLFASIVSAVMWRLFCVSNLLVQIVEDQPLVVRPCHPDRAGGLSAIGDMCMLSAMPAVFIATMVGLMPVLSYYGRIEAPVGVIGGMAALAICAPSLALIFLRPLLAVHRVMLRARYTHRAWLASHVDRVETTLRAAVEEANWEVIPQSSANLQALQNIPSRFPVWPVAVGVGYVALAVQLAGIAVSVTTVAKAMIGKP